MAGVLTINTTMPSVIKRLEGMVADIGDKRAALALARAIGNSRGRGVLSQVKKPASKLMAATIALPISKIKKQMKVTLAPRKPVSIDKTSGSTDFLKRATNPVGFKKKIIRGDVINKPMKTRGNATKINRKKRKIGVAVKWWKNRPAQKIMGAFTTPSNKSNMKNQVWAPQSRGGKLIGIMGPMVSRTAVSRLKPLVKQHQVLLEKLLPREMEAELRRAAGEWTGKGAKNSFRN